MLNFLSALMPRSSPAASVMGGPQPMTTAPAPQRMPPVAGLPTSGPGYDSSGIMGGQGTKALPSGVVGPDMRAKGGMLQQMMLRMRPQQPQQSMAQAMPQRTGMTGGPTNLPPNVQTMSAPQRRSPFSIMGGMMGLR